jgi:hypothetical protein
MDVFFNLFSPTSEIEHNFIPDSESTTQELISNLKSIIPITQKKTKKTSTGISTSHKNYTCSTSSRYHLRIKTKKPNYKY